MVYGYLQHGKLQLHILRDSEPLRARTGVQFFGDGKCKAKTLTRNSF